MPNSEATMQPDQLTAQLLAELLGIGALGLAILWQPRYKLPVAALPPSRQVSPRGDPAGA
ncbi:MAG: hypothetical protein M3P16_02360 [Chloroflexota bacterium]|nr:hypothetical protein [Chloroflexota bacterium]